MSWWKWALVALVGVPASLLGGLYMLLWLLRLVGDIQAFIGVRWW